MEKTLVTRDYQDPAEPFDKRLRWNVVFSDTDQDSAIHISAEDWSGRQITLPAGALIEIADMIREKQPV